MADPRQLVSTVQAYDWNTSAGREVVAGRIFFATNQDRLTADDESCLRRLANSMTPVLMQHGTQIDLRCEGWADPRGAAAYNLELSKRRCDRVIAFLQQALQGGARKATYTINGTGRGERSGPVDRLQYDAERRVDVFVKVTKQPPAVPRFVPAKPIVMTPWAKRRATIFRTYSLDYPLWRRLGLDHLIDEYEQNEEAAYPVRSIKPADQAKVLALLEALASPSDVARIRQEASRGRAERVLAEAYDVEYRRAYDKAYRRSPGTLVK